MVLSAPVYRHQVCSKYVTLKGLTLGQIPSEYVDTFTLARRIYWSFPELPSSLLPHFSGDITLEVEKSRPTVELMISECFRAYTCRSSASSAIYTFFTIQMSLVGWTTVEFETAFLAIYIQIHFKLLLPSPILPNVAVLKNSISSCFLPVPSSSTFLISFRSSSPLTGTMSSPNTSDIGSNSAAVSSSTPSNILLRDLVPSRRRSRPPTPLTRSNSNEAPAPEYSPSTLQRNPWMEISSTHFKAGLRFPLAPCVAHILRRLNICPMQLSPNSIRHIIIFVIVMRVHRFEPSFENFGSLYSFTTSARSGDAGFFYLTSRKECRFLDPLASNVGPWKTKFIFVKTPTGREWPFSLDWKVDTPTPVIEGEGLDGDQISSITTYRYNPKKLLVEEILWLAHLTPAPLQVEGSLVSMVSQARLNRRLRAQFEARARARSTAPETSSHPTPVGSSTPDADVPPAPGSTPIEVGSEETQSRGFRQPASVIPSISVRSQDHLLPVEDLAETSRKRKSRGKSPLRPNSIRSRSESGEGGLPSEEIRLEEERDMTMLRSITECWRTARLDLRGPDHPRAQLEGEKWVPDWQISPRSSVFKTRSGQDSWELYDASCLPIDQAALLHTLFTRMEEHCAHSLVQTANFIRGLTLKCAGFRQNHLRADRANRELRAQISTFHSKEEEWLRSRSLMEARIKELETQMASEAEKAAAIGEKRGFEAGHAAGKIAGAIEGRESFLKSEEFTQQIREARLSGVRDFLKTSTFDTAMEIKAADYLMQGFDRCKSQATLLHGFAPGFDVSRLNPCLDANLQPLPDEDDSPITENDEFSVLLSEIENM
ncbi:UNVERIFIED_CONTAM: hypothetical protein Sindi_0137400 [Sesamum indicum]